MTLHGRPKPAHRAIREIADSLRNSELFQPANPGVDFFSTDEWHAVARPLKLSKRELAVAVLLVEGKTLNAIAASLRSSPHTVRVHVSRLFAKARVRSKLELALRLVVIRRNLKDGRGVSKEVGGSG